MILKEMILGIRCELHYEQKDAFHDELIVSIDGKKLCLKAENIGWLEPIIKFAVIGGSPAYIKASSLVDITGPNRRREYWLRINSRSYIEEFFVKEENLIFF